MPARDRSNSPPRLSRQHVWALRLSVPAAVLALAVFVTPPAHSVPSFTDQTGMPCQACHVGGFGPQLTPFGREFKLAGYTLRAKASIPLAVMAIGSFNHTARAQNPAPQYFKSNDNLSLDQASLFIAAGVNQHIGGFAQITYDGVGRAFSWDNLDLRLVNQGTVAGHDAVYGLSLNNSPMVQDVWNTTPAWGFPYTSSALAQTPAASPLIDGGLAQGVVGLTAYGWFAHHLYLEGGVYVSPKAGTLTWLGADPTSPGSIQGGAPYARVAWQQDLAGGTAEIGAFALKAAINPGLDRSTGYRDHYTDLGLDASWLKPRANGDTITVNLRYTHESSNLQASCALDAFGLGSTAPDCARLKLNEWRGDVAYNWRGKVGLTLGGFATSGTSSAALYPPTNRPDSNGVTAQVDYTPWGAGDSPLGSRLNIRFGVQYTAYGRFNGGVHDIDGNGTPASANDTLRAFTWVAF